uniref:AB hydrolase-1 domain-containing protein n=1 Tax=Pinguiococcus pyrenoidosus TaxID=172671 RepID=A0A7R9Y903_9STRA
MQTVQTQGGHTIALEIRDPLDGGASDLAPVLCVSGGPGLPSSYLHPLVPLLGGRRTIFFDLPGCGASDAPSEPHSYGTDDCVADFCDVVAQLSAKFGLTRAHLLGHSWGGVLALAALLRGRFFEMRLCSLVLLSAGASTTSLLAEARRLREWIRRGEEMRIFKERLAARQQAETLPGAGGLGGPEHAPTEIQQSPYEESMDAAEELFFAKHECRVKPVPDCLRDARNEVSSMYKASRNLESFDVASELAERMGEPAEEAATREGAVEFGTLPVLVLRGEDDFCTQKCVQPVLDLLPSSEEGIIPEAGHYSFLENPEEFSRQVIAFLERHEAS